MAISANRSKVLDKETQLATMGFDTLNSNDSYNTPVSSDTQLSSTLDDSKKNGLDKSSSSSRGTKASNSVKSTSPSALRKIRDITNKVVGEIPKKGYPPVILGAMAKLTNTDEDGFKDFLSGVLKVGNNLRCNSLDKMMQFMDGVNVSDNILGGALLRLLLNWLDRMCSRHDRAYLASLSPIEALATIVGSNTSYFPPAALLTAYLVLNQKAIRKSNGSGVLNAVAGRDVTSGTYLGLLFSKGSKSANKHLQDSGTTNSERATIISESHTLASQPPPPISSSRDTLNTISSLPLSEREAATNEYSGSLSRNYPLTDDDRGDVTSITTGKISQKDKEARTKDTINNFPGNKVPSPTTQTKMYELNNPKLSDRERASISSDIANDLDTSAPLSAETEQSVKELTDPNLSRKERNSKVDASVLAMYSEKNVPVGSLDKIEDMSNPRLTDSERSILSEEVISDLESNPNSRTSLRTKTLIIESANPLLSDTERKLKTDEARDSLMLDNDVNPNSVYELESLKYSNVTSLERTSLLEETILELTPNSGYTPTVEAALTTLTQTTTTLTSKRTSRDSIITTLSPLTKEEKQKVYNLASSNLTVEEKTEFTDTLLVSISEQGKLSPEMITALNELNREDLTPEEKEAKLNDLIVRLEGYPLLSGKDNMLLEALGDLKTMVMIPEETRDSVVEDSGLADKMGVFTIQIMDTDLNSISLANMTADERAFLSKLKQFKANVLADPDLSTRDTFPGAWDDVDFGKYFPKLTPEEEEWLLSQEFKDVLNSHRTLDLHPTTLVLTGAICA